MSAFITDTYTWINIPKMAGKYSKGLMNWSNVKYTIQGKGHSVIPYKDLPNKPVVVIVRHPITFLTSLFRHRQNSHKPWQPDNLEQAVGSNDWEKFLNSVIDHPGWIKSWWHRWIDPYPNCKILKMENIWNEWINLWNDIGQHYDYDQAVQFRNQQINRDPTTVTLLDNLSEKQIDKLYESQKDAFETYNYQKHWKIVEYKKIPKLKKNGKLTAYGQKVIHF